MRRSILALAFVLSNVAGGVANADDRLAATAQAVEAQLGAEIGLGSASKVQAQFDVRPPCRHLVSKLPTCAARLALSNRKEIPC